MSGAGVSVGVTDIVGLPPPTSLLQLEEVVVMIRPNCPNIYTVDMAICMSCSKKLRMTSFFFLRASRDNTSYGGTL